MVKYPCSTWPKPLEGNIQFLAILNAKVALGNFTSVDQCFEKSLNPLSHLTSWETWEVGGNKHTETEKLSGCQVGREHFVYKAKGHDGGGRGSLPSMQFLLPEPQGPHSA